MAHDASITLLVGRRGGGKSTQLEHRLRGNRRLITFAPILRDFRHGYVQAHGLAEVGRIMRRNWRSRKGFRIAYRPPDDELSTIKALHGLSMLLRQVQAPYMADLDDRQITLAVDEANLSFPHHRPRGLDGFKWAILQGRHAGINIFAATQRPTLVHPDLRDNADRWIVFPVGGDQALSTVLQAVGRHHADAIRALPNHHFIEFADGHARPGKNPPLRRGRAKKSA